MDNYFNKLKNLTTIENMQNLKTKNVTSMNSLFYNCINLASIELCLKDVM